MDSSSYDPPLSLTIISGISLGLGALFMLINIGDIVWRRGWRSMMWIMIPDYPINATYLGPLALYIYFKYGRAQKSAKSHMEGNAEEGTTNDHNNERNNDQGHPNRSAKRGVGEIYLKDPPVRLTFFDRQGRLWADTNRANNRRDELMSSRPMWVMVFIGVSHCGAGCVLGDLVGEWLVYSIGARINGADIWPSLLIDYAFALLFGLMFQYFSIAPRAGEWGLRTMLRAILAEIPSLTSFEIGLFGWMVASQVGIFKYMLTMDTWLYWWMMQVGLIFGFATAVPVNWWLISKVVKEPCI